MDSAKLASNEVWLRENEDGKSKRKAACIEQKNVNSYKARKQLRERELTVLTA